MSRRSKNMWRKSKGLPPKLYEDYELLPTQLKLPPPAVLITRGYRRIGFFWVRLFHTTPA